MARVYHVRNLAPVSKENKRCTSQQTPISIVELVHRFHGKTRIFLFFVRNRGWLKQFIHNLYFVGQRTGPGNEHNKAQGGLRMLVPCAKILHIIECAAQPSAVVTWP